MNTNKTQAIEAAMTARIASQTTAGLQDMARQLNTDYRDGCTLVFSLVLHELERRMPESEFCNFCDNLD
ncbi:MAG: hypothetical protein DELT_00514 [Desulfovibrio sp.]